MIVLVGASASGKTELAKILFRIHGYTKCITTTTRAPRTNERNDIDYHFLTEEEFLDRLSKNAFFEAATYNQYHYGIQKKDVNENGIVIVEPQGANTLIDALGTSVFVVYVHASERLRRKRMEQRKDHPDLIEKRIQNDQIAFQPEFIKRIDLRIENEDHTLEELAEIIHLAYQKHLKNQKSKEQ